MALLGSPDVARPDELWVWPRAGVRIGHVRGLSPGLARNGRGLDRRPGEVFADRAQRRASRLVAERALDADLVELLRAQPASAGLRVLARQVGPEHGRVVGGERAAKPGRDHLRQRV